jgi:lysosomal Pro-X carboxypeptidase
LFELGFNFSVKLIQTATSCSPLEHPEELKEYLAIMYVYSAQFNNPSVKALCETIDGAAFGSNILNKIYGGVVAFSGNITCKVNSDKYIVIDEDIFSGWGWQVINHI